MRSMRIIKATVPILFSSSKLGSSILSSFCETTPIILSDLYASLINLMDLSRPTVIGITTPGNKTVFRKGNIESTSGMFSEFICSSSSLVNKGIKSLSRSSSMMLFSCRLLNSKLSLIWV